MKWPFNLLIIIGFMAILGLVAYFRKHLTFSGAVAASTMGVIVLWSVMIEGFSVLLFFYASSYLVSFFARRVSSEENKIEKKGANRDYIQVLANGLVCTLAALLYYNTGKYCYLVMFGSALAEATSDTWAGEFGRLSSIPPVSMRTGKPVEKGTSGGVTFVGFSGAFAGSAITAGFWKWAFDYELQNSAIMCLIVIFCGFFGCLVDSFLGATVQAMYEDSASGKLTEHDTDIAGNPQKLVRGFKWIDNDIVNLISNTVSGLMGLVLCSLF